MPIVVVAVAQLVEHRIVAPEVAGSKPVSHPIPVRPLWPPHRATIHSANENALRQAGVSARRLYLDRILGARGQ